jgi:hypothetical protein
MEEQKKILLTAGSVVCVLALAVIVYFLFFRTSKEETVPLTSPAAQEEVLPAEAESARAETEELEPLSVDLENSDDVVRQKAVGLSSNDLLAKWLQTKGIIPKFTAAVDNIANGMSPRTHIDFFKPAEKFNIEWEDDTAYISPASYDRYNPVAAVVSSLDAAGSAELFLRLKPVFQEAYTELGYPQGDFEKTLERAFGELLEVPVPEGDIAVEQNVQTYIYLDPRLEGLSEAQKHLLRMGPRNIQLIQSKIREIAAALGLTLSP